MPNTKEDPEIFEHAYLMAISGPDSQDAWLEVFGSVLADPSFRLLHFCFTRGTPIDRLKVALTAQAEARA